LRGCGYESASGRQRWLNQDPLGELGFETQRDATELPASEAFADEGLNRYTYVGNNPANKIDPFGLAAGIPPSQGISIPPSVPNSEELKKFYGNIAPTLVANCMLNCEDCELGKFMGKNPPGSKKKKKPQPKK